MRACFGQTTRLFTTCSKTNTFSKQAQQALGPHTNTISLWSSLVGSGHGAPSWILEFSKHPLETPRSITIKHHASRITHQSKNGVIGIAQAKGQTFGPCDAKARREWTETSTETVNGPQWSCWRGRGGGW
jgi:hypothetical protein